MNLKKSPLIFIIILVIVLAFIIGVRRGQQVEKKNKVIDFLISIPPSPTIQPTRIPLEFKTYQHDGCKLQFLYPNYLEKAQTSSQSAKFEGDFQSLEFNCSKNSAVLLTDDKKLAAVDLKFKGKSLKGKVRPAKNPKEAGNPTFLFNLVKPQSSKNIYIGISKSLYPLFEKSFEFIQ